MGLSFKKILAPVDFHEHAMGALEIAKNIAQVNDGTVTLLYVVPMDEPIGGKMYEEDFKKQAEKDAVRLAELAAKNMQGIKCEVLTEIGDPATAILDTAAKKAVDVIVMGTHGRKSLMRIMMGSVAEDVLRHAQSPVIVYRLEKKA
jgi:nucleotide-binding universal stress UspA family protein